MQYTIRGVPPALDAVLRERARVTGRSLNEVVIDALAEGAGVSLQRKRRNVDDIAGTWIEDKGFDEAIAAQDQIDWDLWK